MTYPKFFLLLIALSLAAACRETREPHAIQTLDSLTIDSNVVWGYYDAEEMGVIHNVHFRCDSNTVVEILNVAEISANIFENCRLSPKWGSSVSGNQVFPLGEIDPTGQWR